MKKKTIPNNLVEILKWEPEPYERKQAIIVNYLRGAESYLIVGCLLCQSTSDWDKDGSGAHNFFEWVEKELKIKRSNAQRMMLIWGTLHKYLNKHGELILQIDFAKLALICPLLGSMKEPEALEWLHAAKENTVRDLEHNVKVFKGVIPDVCDHINVETWNKCLKCQKFFK
jgi:hypothetical protein